MPGTSVIIIAGLVWVGLLFGVALLGERRPRILERRWSLVYALSLAVHCTSWTFYGTVGQASRSGWWLPPTFVGAIGLYIIAAPLLVRLVQLVRQYNAGSLADLIATRLGRHSGLAALVTAVMLLGIVPYIALQLKAVSMSYGMLSRANMSAPAPWQDSALYVALLMAVFTMLFGTRRAAATEHNRGLVLALAFESLFKLLAMLAVGVLLLWPGSGLPVPDSIVEPVSSPGNTAGFAPLILLGALAMFTMPHQFHAGIVECRDSRHVRKARWIFPLYLLLIAAPILPLARLGDRLLQPSGVPADLYVLALPMAQGADGIALLAFLGGLSAATSMVVIATLALSLMVASHFIAPLRVRTGWGRQESGDLRGAILGQRRIAILVIVLLAWLYSRLLIGNDALADVGAVSFSALAALAPATLLATYRPRTGAVAVGAGLLVGTLVWLYALLPGYLALSSSWVVDGPWRIGWLAPESLFGLGGWSRLGRAVTVSLLANAAVVMLVAQSRWGRVSQSVPGQGVAVARLRTLAQRFLAPRRVDQLLGDSAPGLAPAALVAAVEHELAAVIGASSARLLLDVVRDRDRQDFEAVTAIIDEATHDLRFNQRVLAAALANMSQGICVVDERLRVVAWNRPYAELFRYPAGMLEVGRPVAELMAHNIRAGLIGAGPLAERVQRRLEFMRQGTAHLAERQFGAGTTVEIRGNPIPGGGYVATFTDVTAFREAERSLQRANETLEQRVAERTRKLQSASAEAHKANAAKTHFLAAVSHDLLQPLHAAQLFCHALPAQERTEDRDNVRHLQGALTATESLLAGLLDIARLEGDQLTVQLRSFPVAQVLQPLTVEFQALAGEEGVRMAAIASSCWVHSDPQLLRRVVQNFLANAVRYAGSGGGRIVLGCRRRDGHLVIEVWDNGPGIAAMEQEYIFEQFRRGPAASGQGLGLGLAIARRMADLLGHPLQLRSRPGQGSVFSVHVPLAKAPAGQAAVRQLPAMPEPAAGRALLLDNDPAALAGLTALLRSWQWQCHASRNAEQALQVPWTPQLLLLDYHLDGGATGLQALQQLRLRFGDVPAVVLTADRDAQLQQAIVAAGAQVLHKPLRPLALQQILKRHRQAHAGGQLP